MQIIGHLAEHVLDKMLLCYLKNIENELVYSITVLVNIVFCFLIVKSISIYLPAFSISLF
jgi:hypothetical protein